MKRKKVTIRDIAKIANVSISTVSRVSNGTGRISKETREEIFRIMKENNYQPKSEISPSANNPNNESGLYKQCIGIIVQSITSEFLTSLAGSICENLEEDGYSPLLCDLNNHPEREPAKLNAFYSAGVSGVIIISSRNKHTVSIVRTDIPTIFIDQLIKSSYDVNIYSVCSDHLIGGKLAAEELIKKGCRRPLIFNNRDILPKENERITGFIQQFQEHNLVIDEDLCINMFSHLSNAIEAKNLVTYIKTKGISFDSIYATNDWRAYGAILALRELDIRIPEDVCVIGYDGLYIAQNFDIPITTVAQDIKALSSQTCRMLKQLIAHKPVSKHQIVIPTHLIQGKTT
jgi:DNA-binding LacI/PurR family transcriptional regulator